MVTVGLKTGYYVSKICAPIRNDHDIYYSDYYFRSTIRVRLGDGVRAWRTDLKLRPLSILGLNFNT